MQKRYILRILVALVAAFGLLSSVSAHAKLDTSEPAAGAKLTSVPTKITLNFTEEISEKPTDSYFTVTDAKGTKVGSGQLDTSDLDHKTLTGTLNAGAGDGVYTVSWVTVTTDDNGHSDGVFTFGVNADPGVQPTAAPHSDDDDDDATAQPTAASTAQPTLAPTTASTAAATTTAATAAATTTAGSASATQPTPTPATPGLPNTGGESTHYSWLLLVAVLLIVGAVVVRRGASRPS